MFQKVALIGEFLLNVEVTAEREVWTVDLQKVPAIDDGFVLCSHGFCQRPDICLESRVVLVRLLERESAWATRVQERLNGRLGLQCCAEILEIFSDLVMSRVANRSGAASKP